MTTTGTVSRPVPASLSISRYPSSVSLEFAFPRRRNRRTECIWVISRDRPIGVWAVTAYGRGNAAHESALGGALSLPYCVVAGPETPPPKIRLSALLRDPEALPHMALAVLGASKLNRIIEFLSPSPCPVFSVLSRDGG
jgi:hypothetical protein